MRKYTRQIQQGKQKAENKNRLLLEAQLPMSELIAGVRQDIEGFAAQLGLTIIQRVMAAEIEQKVGKWGQQQTHRHGHQPGTRAYRAARTRHAGVGLRRARRLLRHHPGDGSG